MLATNLKWLDAQFKPQFAAQTESLQNPIFDMQLPVAARRQARVVCNDKERLVAVARS